MTSSVVQSKVIFLELETSLPFSAKVLCISVRWNISLINDRGKLLQFMFGELFQRLSSVINLSDRAVSDGKQKRPVLPQDVHYTLTIQSNSS